MTIDTAGIRAAAEPSPIVAFRKANPDIWQRAAEAVMAPKVSGTLFGEAYILPLAIAMRDLIEAQAARVKELEAGLSASVGYLLNAKIDLETGATKATAARSRLTNSASGGRQS